MGAAVLSQATSSSALAGEALGYARQLTTPQGQVLDYSDVTALAYYETGLAFGPGTSERSAMATQLTSLSTLILASNSAPTGPGAAFRAAIDNFYWGSMTAMLSAGVMAILARKLSGGGTDGAEIARTQLHWLFGQNPFGVSFMVGLGTRNPRNLHHNLTVAPPVPVTLVGAIVNGPVPLATLASVFTNPTRNPPATDPYSPFSTNDLLYEDAFEDYVTNEPAIDTPAPLVFLLGELLEQP